jgi:hypothetical protein
MALPFGAQLSLRPEDQSFVEFTSHLFSSPRTIKSFLEQPTYEPNESPNPLLPIAPFPLCSKPSFNHNPFHPLSHHDPLPPLLLSSPP